MSHWFNKQELLQKANVIYYNCVGKGKAAEYRNILKTGDSKRKNKK